MYDLLGDGSNPESSITNSKVQLHDGIDKFIGELPSLNRYLNLFARNGGVKKRRKNGKRKRNRKRKGTRRKKKNRSRQNQKQLNDPDQPKQMLR